MLVLQKLQKILILCCVCIQFFIYIGFSFFSFLFFQNDTSCDELFELFHLILNISLSFSIGCTVSIQMGLQEIQKPTWIKIGSLYISWISSISLNIKTVFAFGILVRRLILLYWMFKNLPSNGPCFKAFINKLWFFYIIFVKQLHCIKHIFSQVKVNYFVLLHERRALYRLLI